MTLRRAVNSKTPKRQTEPTKPHRYAEPVFYRLCSCSAGEIATIKFLQFIPI
jgi:hypothetical protein